jgi:4-carboxymuconolactone decarboxylase
VKWRPHQIPGRTGQPGPVERRVRTSALAFHVGKALDDGIGRDEPVELITWLAYHVGRQTTNTALQIGRRVLGERQA